VREEAIGKNDGAHGNTSHRRTFLPDPLSGIPWPTAGRTIEFCSNGQLWGLCPRCLHLEQKYRHWPSGIQRVWQFILTTFIRAPINKHAVLRDYANAPRSAWPGPQRSPIGAILAQISGLLPAIMKAIAPSAAKHAKLPNRGLRFHRISYHSFHVSS
jgi:hypothetical protein